MSNVKKKEDDLASMRAENAQLRESLDRLGQPVRKGVETLTEAPAIRKGEDHLTSRPFRLLTMLGYIGGKVKREKATVEADLLDGFRKALEETTCVPENSDASSALFPISHRYLPDQAAAHEGTTAFRKALNNTWSDDTDHDEAAWIARRIGKSYEPSFQKTAMSYLTETTGGALVAPPEMGEIIPLMRNASAVDRAGARNMPLPPQGKWVAPRITGPSTGYWIGENTAITESNPTTGQVALQAKKLGVLVRLPNELFRYASAAADALMRDDMAKTLALGFDYACLYGLGNGGQPKGLIYYTGTGEFYDYAADTPAPKGISTNGNVLRPEDGYRMSSVTEDRNFDLSGYKWIMRPRLKGTILSYRGDGPVPGDANGVFVQDLTRALGFAAPAQWCGYPIVASSQVRNNQTKGTNTACTEVFGGVWDNFLMGMYGAVEFAANSMGEATFTQDQTLIRAILHCDAAPRYPGAFGYYKLVSQT